MIPLGIGLFFGGYSVASWGWVLIKGYNVTFKEWMSPLGGFQFRPGVTTPTVPKGKIWPAATDTASSGGGGTAGSGSGGGGGGAGTIAV